MRAQTDDTLAHVQWFNRVGAAATGAAEHDVVVFPQECSLKPVSPPVQRDPYGRTRTAEPPASQQAGGPTGRARTHDPSQIPNQPRCYVLEFPEDKSRNLFFW